VGFGVLLLLPGDEVSGVAIGSVMAAGGPSPVGPGAFRGAHGSGVASHPGSGRRDGRTRVRLHPAAKAWGAGFLP